MSTFRVGGRVIRYTIRENSNSKYLVLNLRKDRVLEISLPRDSGLGVKRILEKKRPWIERKFEELSKRRRVVGNKRVLYLGHAYLLKLFQEGRQKVRIQRDKILLTAKKGQKPREVLRGWMAGKSKKYATRKAIKFAKLLGINFDFTVETKDMKSWGRCVDRKHLLFNWQLIGLPTWLAEYVVAHELTHLVEGSHSRKFERKLTVICPRHKELREELKNFSL